MKASRFSVSLLAAALSLAASGAGAQAPAKTDATAEKELAAARAELARAAKRVAELSQKTAEGQMRRAQIERLRARRPVLGVILTPDDAAGVRIAGVTPDSAAAKAGLQTGDRIVSVDDVQVLGNTGELRMQNARKLLGKLEDKKPAKVGYTRGGRNAVVSVTPQVDRPYTLVFDEDGKNGVIKHVKIDTDRINRIVDDVRVRIPDMDYDFDFDFEGVDFAPGISDEIARELHRVMPACKGDDCKAPVLLSAFRWNGLNLAAVDPQLGRYFGTDRGVLVLSNGEIAGLQAGDVIQRIDGKAVNSPREAMDVLRDKPGDATANVAYLRDRKSASAQIKVPRLMAFPPVPPAPPRPPSAPKPPAPPKPPAAMKAPAPQAPPAPPAPPKAPAVGVLTAPGPAVVWLDKDVDYAYVSEDGQTAAFSWSADGAEPLVIEPVEPDTTR